MLLLFLVQFRRQPRRRYRVGARGCGGFAEETTRVSRKFERSFVEARANQVSCENRRISGSCHTSSICSAAKEPATQAIKGELREER